MRHLGPSEKPDKHMLVSDGTLSLGMPIYTWPVGLNLCSVLAVVHVYEYRCITCVADTCVIHMLYTCHTHVAHLVVLTGMVMSGLGTGLFIPKML